MLRAATDVNYSDSYYAGIDPTDLYFVDSFTVWNAQLSLGAIDERWSATLFGQNVLDENYWTSANISNDFWYRGRGAPLNYGLRIRYVF